MQPAMVRKWFNFGLFKLDYWREPLGRTNSGSGGSYELRQVDVDILTAAKCKKKFPDIAFDPATQLCAGDSEEKDTCNVCNVKRNIFFQLDKYFILKGR